MSLQKLQLVLTYFAYGFGAARTLFQALCCSSLTSHKKLSKKFEKSYIVGMRMNSLPNNYMDDTEDSHTYAYLHYCGEGGRGKKTSHSQASADNLQGTQRSDDSLLISHQTPPSAWNDKERTHVSMNDLQLKKMDFVKQLNWMEFRWHDIAKQYLN